MSSETNFAKVKIEGIFNLEEFSKEYKMTPQEVIQFHNQHCGLQELLSLNLSKYVQHVYLPYKNYEEEDIKVLKSTTLELPTRNEEKDYGVVIKFSPKDLQIHYKIKVQRTLDLLTLTKDKTYVNNQKIEQTIEQLFEKANNTLYPLQILTERNGTLSKIVNADEVAERWKKETFPKLKDYYQSETTDKILQQFDDTFCNLNKKRQFLERNMFYKLFFLPIYQTYAGFKKESLLQIYHADIAKQINYKMQYTLQKKFTRGNKIALKITGVEDDNLFNENREKGKVELLYKLDKETKVIYSIAGFISYFENDKKHNVNFQLYELGRLN
ncbi:hypothetical protein [Chryseobacterium sp. 5_R23647]|uniref:hypothetical protein n=1 Tax=Chryseobacterium sp. 5_R23647 TaxID=2258964 RepID=UPI000E255876|nr:hypothetical protein [Chryseobacterium sp. 5_R23647]REC43020.1 hypothetical protein DRF69_09850 [Chryseobacterium sp. 5_R23647]